MSKPSGRDGDDARARALEIHARLSREHAADFLNLGAEPPPQHKDPSGKPSSG